MYDSSGIEEMMTLLIQFDDFLVNIIGLCLSYCAIT